MSAERVCQLVQWLERLAVVALVALSLSNIVATDPVVWTPCRAESGVACVETRAPPGC